MLIGDRVQVLRDDADCILLQVPSHAWLLNAAQARELAKALIAASDEIETAKHDEHPT